MMRRLKPFLMFSLMLSLLVAGNGQGQVNHPANQPDSSYYRLASTLIDSALAHGRAYAMLQELVRVGTARLSGSPQAAAAVEWAYQTMKALGLENVHRQPVLVPHWVRGEVEYAAIVNSGRFGTVPLSICALGGSVATPETGITAPVVEVHSLEEVEKLGDRVKGKIVFYNRPLDPTQRVTFRAYAGAVDQRTYGAVYAARQGAVAVLVRSMSTSLDDVPHTGAMRYKPDVPKIPAAAISTLDAEFLSRALKADPELQVRLQLNCRTLPDVRSANVIGEIRGSQHPEEVILLGAHLDAWDKGQGAHDDGSGCVHVLEALRLIRALGLKPARTIRGVLYMNEENGLRGARAYADSARNSGLTHLVAIESDRGGFTPRGFTVGGTDDVLARIQRWAGLFSEIGADRIVRGGGGADISPLKKLGTVQMGLVVDSNRYFDYHHSDNDTIDKVNQRELELGAASLAIMAYVLSMEGI
ncbi:MAG: peptidase M28 family protein [Calditrichaeota bacterium]|nr:MAG: peptidase M28 family protein [Calditrichota bacterium]